MKTDMVLLPGKEGQTLLGILTPFGIVGISTFSYDELRKFAMGMLGYVEHFHPEIPDVFLKAWDKKEDESCQLKLM